MEAQIHIPDALTYAGLDAALQGLTGLAELELLDGTVPSLYESGVRYEREPRGSERWLTPSMALLRGAADCEDLAAWRAAELRVSGEDTYAQPQVVRTSPNTWHAVVARSDGSFEDPSAALGMTHASGLVAPFRFELSPEARRDYRARVELNGLGWFADFERVDDDGARALLGALDDAMDSELGVIPFVGPVLDIVRTAADLATGKPQRQQQQQAPRAPAAAKRPSGRAEPVTLEAGVLELALQLRRLAKREQARLARQQTEMQRALRRSVR